MFQKTTLFFLICSLFLISNSPLLAMEGPPSAQSARQFNKGKDGCGIVLVNSKTVLRIFSPSEVGVSAYDRADMIAQKINDLISEGYDVGSVEPSMIDNIAVGVVNKIPVFSIEPGDAVRANMPPLLLAFDWANRIRRAYDAPLLTQNIIDEIVKLERMKGIKVEVRKDKGESAGILIDGRAVIRMYGVQSGESAYDRARNLAQGLEESIMSGQEWVNKLREALGSTAFSSDTIKSSLTQFGKASWYGGFFHGRRTSSGERYNMYDYTAAHKQLPFGTEVLVTRLDNAKSVVVRITDRGPYIAGRIIDLSKSAAQALGLVKSGVAKVRVDVINPIPVPSP